ncbi:hypothetical protein EC968_006041 [Mortierella alpina]|nr:hypothetical protein EC968_006041 [Mortierella alpina]
MADSSFLTPPLSPKSMPLSSHTNMQQQQQQQQLPSSAAIRSSTPTSGGELSPNSSNHGPLTQILVLYHKATSTFLLRQLASAYSVSLEALELLSRTNQDYGLDQSPNISTRRSFFILKQKLWILHATIFGAMLTDRTTAAASETTAGGASSTTSSTARNLVHGVRKRVSGSTAKDSPEKLVKDLWRRIVEDYGGLEGDVDGQVMVPFVLLCINQKLFALGRQIVEAYLATIPEGMLIHLETAAGVALVPAGSGSNGKDPLMTNYERLVELYLIHVLAKLAEWDYAAEFLQYNSVLSETSKKTYSKILDKLHQRSLRPKKKTVSTKQQRSSLDSPPKSSATSSVPSIASTSVSSPTLSSASTMGSPATSHALDEPRNSSGVSAASYLSSTQSNQTTSQSSSSKQSSSSSSGSHARTKVALNKKESVSVVSASTVQGRLWILLQHYVDLVKSASSQMGSQQLMVIVGLVVFLGTLARNRERASRYWKASVAKVMQTVKMGTTVTSI